MRSDVIPQNHAPASMPRKVAVTSSPPAARDTSNSALIAGSAKAISRISAASAAHVTPQTSSSRRWKRPKPT